MHQDALGLWVIAAHCWIGMLTLSFPCSNYLANQFLLGLSPSGLLSFPREGLCPSFLSNLDQITLLFIHSYSALCFSFTVFIKYYSGVIEQEKCHK